MSPVILQLFEIIIHRVCIFAKTNNDDFFKLLRSYKENIKIDLIFLAAVSKN